MRKIYLPCLLVAFLNSAVCQEKAHDLNPEKLDPFFVEIDIKKKNRIPVSNFSRLILKDTRQDTSKMGYVTMSKKNYRIVFKKEGVAYFNDALNDAILPQPSTNTIIVLLNDLWMNETRTRAGWVHKSLLGSQELVSSCYVHADLYVQDEKGSIRHLGTVDTTAIKKGGWLPANAEKVLTRGIAALLESADTLFTEDKKETVLLTPEQLNELILHKYDYPILNTDKPMKGVYFSYKDFLDNKPAAIPFQVVNQVKGNILKYKQTADTSEDTAWGYCDGENIFMHLGKKYFQLVRRQHSYEVLGPETVEIINTFADKTVDFAWTYFFHSGIFKLLAFEAYTKPDLENFEFLKLYKLNIHNGLLR